MTTTAKKSPSTTTPPIALLLIYPATLLIGSLFSAISPTARGSRDGHEHPAPLTPSIAADVNLSSPPPTPVNYFARKNNIFNVYFVKIGWLWTTLALASLVLSQYARSSATRPRRIAQTVLRYSLATLVWYLTTQWFFGPAIIDRGFVITGGKCERLVKQASEAGMPSGLEESFTATACKAAGGVWRGGHDVSGHIFMLVLATAMLVFEAWGFTIGTTEVVENGKEKQDGEHGEENGVLKGWALRFVGAVAGLEWWMLFMTAIWFHTWLEKWTGLSIALGTVYIIYILPRTLGQWRDVVGIPGV